MKVIKTLVGMHCHVLSFCHITTEVYTTENKDNHETSISEERLRGSRSDL
jgi:hypothetical protein